MPSRSRWLVGSSRIRRSPIVRLTSGATDAGERASQRHALHLTAGQRGDVEVRRAAHAEPVEDRRRPPNPSPTACGDGAGGQRRVLVEDRQPGLPAPAHRSGLGRDRAGEHLQEGRLAPAVDAHDPEAVTARHGDREALEQGLARGGSRSPQQRRRGSPGHPPRPSPPRSDAARYRHAGGAIEPGRHPLRADRPRPPPAPGACLPSRARPARASSSSTGRAAWWARSGPSTSRSWSCGIDSRWTDRSATSRAGSSSTGSRPP